MFMEQMQDTMDRASNISVTENGAIGYKTSGKALVDFNFAVSSMRKETEMKVLSSFKKVFEENPEVALRYIFFLRDVRGGLGERRTFRICFKWILDNYYAQVKHLLKLIPEFGRWDDLWYIMDENKKAEKEVAKIITEQFYADIDGAISGQSISMLAKWLPSAKTRNKFKQSVLTKILSALGMERKEYSKTLSFLREYLQIVERKMSRNEWEEIDYEKVPSRANLIYNSAFLRHDESRRRNFLAAVNRGEKKINSSTVYPYEIVYRYGHCPRVIRDDLEAMWKALPDTVNGNNNTLVVCDGSGSMYINNADSSARCSDVANSLAVYFSERASGEFKDKYITFSHRPQLVNFQGCTSLANKLRVLYSHDEYGDTNIEAVFRLILKTALEHNISQEDMPKNILVLSDMEFNDCAVDCCGECFNKLLFDNIAEAYEKHGYKLPRLVFWNICSRTGTIPVRENEMGVALVSGFSVNVMKMVLSGKLDPYEVILETIYNKRYDRITFKPRKAKVRKIK